MVFIREKIQNYRVIAERERARVVQKKITKNSHCDRIFIYLYTACCGKGARAAGEKKREKNKERTRVKNSPGTVANGV